MDDRQQLKNFLRRLSGLPLLTEQDDLFGDEEGGEEEGEEEDTGEEDTTDEEGGEEGADEAGEGEEEEAPDPSVGTDDSLDGELSAIFVDIESKSMKKEAYNPYSLARHLLVEQDEEEEASAGAILDVNRFAEETARIFRNVEAFLDIEEIILKKAEEFVSQNHGEEKAEQLLNILKNRYNIVKKDEKETTEIDVKASVPIAVGASSGGGGV